MQPSDRALRDVLRREAAQVRVPDDMWANISRRLADSPSAPDKTPWLLHFWQQGRSVLALAAAAALFLVMPTPWHLEGQQMDRPKPLPVVALASNTQPDFATRNVPLEDVMLIQQARKQTNWKSDPEPIRRSNPFQVNTPR
ncbi:MAG: hypothetical protein ACM3XM_04015 [Mycobacterium leprae]